MSPRSIARRMPEDETLAPPSRTSATMLTSKPSSAPCRRRLSTSPIRPLPNRKSNPTLTERAPTWLTITRSQNSRSVIAAIAESNFRRCSSLTPIASIAICRRSGVINRNGAASGWRNRRGAGSNVATPHATPSRFAAAPASAITARCPACSPSKLPSAMAAPDMAAYSARPDGTMTSASPFIATLPSTSPFTARRTR